MKAAYGRADVGFATKPNSTMGDDCTRDRRQECRSSFVVDSEVAREISKPLRKAARAMFWEAAAKRVFNPGAREHLFVVLPFPKIFLRAWRRLSVWANHAALADWVMSNRSILMPGQYNSTFREWTRGLLIRRNIADGDLAFFSTQAQGYAHEKNWSWVEGHLLGHRGQFRNRQERTRPDHNESRSWHGWHRHVSLVMFALAMMAVIRHAANAPPLKNELLPANSVLRSAGRSGEIRCIAMKLGNSGRIQPNIIAWSLWRRTYQAHA